MLIFLLNFFPVCSIIATMDNRYEWRVEYLSYYDLENRLNELSREGFDVVKIQFIPGMPEKSVPGLQGKPRRSDEWIVILNRPLEEGRDVPDGRFTKADLEALGEYDIVSETAPEVEEEDWDAPEHD